MFQILSANTYYFISYIIIFLLLLFCILFLIRIVLLINKTGILKCFTHIWHILEFVLIIVGLSFVIIYFIYSYHRSLMTEYFQLTGNYFKFFLLFQYSRIFYTLIFILVGLLTLKIVRLCKFGPKFSTFNESFKLMKKAIIFICVTLFLIHEFQILIYYLTNEILAETNSLPATIYNKNYGLIHHSSFLLPFIFVFLYSVISILSLVLVIYYWETKVLSDKNSFNYFTFIINEVKKSVSKRKYTN